MSGQRNRGRPLASSLGVAVIVALALLAAWRLLPHPVGPARTLGKYQGKAKTSAESVLSNVETVRVAIDALRRDGVFGPYLSTLVGEAEDAVGGASGTFDSIQPPDRTADDLRHNVDDVFSTALDDLRDVRVVVRRGERARAIDAARPLDDDVARLQDLIGRLGS